MFTRAEYEAEMLGRIYDDLSGHDPEGVLRYEWVNARGAIARFDRGAIEIRLIDTQECPAADLAVVAAVTEVVRALAVGPLSERDWSDDPAHERLAELLGRTIQDGDAAILDDGAYLATLGINRSESSAADVWRTLMDRYPPSDPSGEWTPPLQTLLDRGPLARRMLSSVDRETVESGTTAEARAELHALFGDLSACLLANEPFAP